MRVLIDPGHGPGNVNGGRKQAYVILETLGVKTIAPLPEHIIDMLSGKVWIASPDYWVNVLKGKEQVNVRFLNTLLARLAGFNV